MLMAGAIAVPQAEAGTVGATPAAVAAGQAGYLDRSFMGGAGYRVLPTPGWVTQDVRGRWSAQPLALVASKGGGWRTVVQYRDASCSSGYSGAMRGWTANGWIDTSFYKGGTRCFEVNTQRQLRTLSARSNGTLAAAFGIRGSSGSTRHELRSYLASGRLLGVHPYLSTDPLETNYPPTGDPIVIKRDGAARQCQPGPKKNENTTATLGRWLPNGTKLASVPLTLVNCREHAIDKNDTVFIAGGFSNSRSTTIQVARLLADGRVDQTFGSGGYASIVLPIGSASPPRIFKAALAPDSRGGAYVAVTLGSTAVAHLTPSGQVDTSFSIRVLGGTGSILRGQNAPLIQMVADAKGPILSLGGLAADPYSPPGDGYVLSGPFRLVRLAANTGALDPSWGRGGVVSTSDPTLKMAFDSSGRLVTLNGGATIWSQTPYGSGCTACPVKLVKRLT
jgi:hypothetical protein